MQPRPPTSTLFPYTTLFRSTPTTYSRDSKARRIRTAIAARSAAGDLPAYPGSRADLRRQLDWLDRKSTRLNSSHPSISYAVFCLKKKKNTNLPNLRFALYDD